MAATSAATILLPPHPLDKGFVSTDGDRNYPATPTACTRAAGRGGRGLRLSSGRPSDSWPFSVEGLKLAITCAFTSLSNDH
jgi:hypothetical protein